MRRLHYLVMMVLLAVLMAACAPRTDMSDSAMTDTMTDMADTSGDMMDMDAFTLQLLHFADVDGGRDIIGNVPRFSALLNAFREQMPEHTLVLSSGDNWIPGPEYNVAEDAALNEVLGTAGAGRAHVAWLNALGVQASAFGNHEFDLGTEAVAELLQPGAEDDSWTGAMFPYLSTNLDFSTDEALAPLIGTDGAAASELAGQVAAYTVIDVSGEPVGVIGATTPSLRSISSIGGITMQPENPQDIEALAALIQEDADALSDMGINKIILLAHMQSISIEQSLAPLLSNVDIIVAGGSNTILADSNDRLREGDNAVDTYPMSFTSSSGEPVLIVNVDGDYNYLGRLVVDFDSNGVIIPSSLDESVNGAYATDDLSMLEQALLDSDAMPEVTTISDALASALAVRAGNVVGYSDVYLNGARLSVRTEETNFGNLSADAHLDFAQQIDPSTSISIKNGGGIRGAIGACIVPPGSTDVSDQVCSAPTGIAGITGPGAVSQLDLEIALRFNNDLSLITVTGAELHALMENGVGGVENVAGAFPQIAGMTVTYDPNQPAGSRVVNLTVSDANGALEGEESVTVVEDGRLNPDAADQTFRVVTLSFLAEGGDNYPFPTGDSANIVSLTSDTRSGQFTFANDGTEQDVLAEYFATHYPDPANAYDLSDTPAAQDTRIINLSAQ